MLSNIGGRDAPSPDAAAPGAAAPSRSFKIGWMGYVGSVLWLALFCGAGLAGWLLFTGAG